MAATSGGVIASITIPIREIPAALHRAKASFPSSPTKRVRVRLEPGATIQRHKHTGEVFAFTLAGAWKYLEYPEVNTAGSYLFEPAGSIHTLHALKSNDGITDAWFAIRGANLNLDAAGNVESVLDAALALEIYTTRCREAGHPMPNVIGI